MSLFLACQQLNRVCDIVRAGLVGAHYAEFVNKLHFKQKNKLGGGN
jgi:hypothetical protein